VILYSTRVESRGLRQAFAVFIPRTWGVYWR
jgi:hypothetical protein